MTRLLALLLPACLSLICPAVLARKPQPHHVVKPAKFKPAKFKPAKRAARPVVRPRGLHNVPRLAFGQPYQNATGRLVMAHYVLANYDYGKGYQGPGLPLSLPYAYTQDIRDAKACHVDGFLLNFGGYGSAYINDIAAFFQAADDYNRLHPASPFVLALNPDCSGSIESNFGALVALVEQYQASPAYWRYKGRPVVGTYAGGGGTWAAASGYWQQDFLAPLHAAGINPYFVPWFSFTHSDGSYSRPSEDQAAAISGAVGGLYKPAGADGGFRFMGGPQTQETFASALKSAGLSQMSCVFPQYWPHRRNVDGNYVEMYGGEGLTQQWLSVINRQKPFAVCLVTWNDEDEATQFTPANISQFWPYLFRSFVPGYYPSKAGLDAENAYFIQWFETGTQPAIVSDSLFEYHRVNPLAMVCADPAGPPAAFTDINGHVVTPPDDLFVDTLLQSPGKLSVTSGSVTTTYPVPAGLAHTRVPFHVGAQSFSLYRNGALVMTTTGQPVVAQSDYYNFQYATSTVTK